MRSRPTTNRYRRRVLSLEKLHARELFSIDLALFSLPSFFQLESSQSPQTLEVVERQDFPDGYEGPKRITQLSISRNGVETRISPDGRSILYTVPLNALSEDSIDFVIDDVFRRSISLTSPHANVDKLEFFVGANPIQIELLKNDWLPNGPRKITRILDLRADEKATISEDGQSILFSTSSKANEVRTLRYVVDDKVEGQIEIAVYRAVQDDQSKVIRNSRDVSVPVLENDEYYSVFYRQNRRVVSTVTSVTGSDKGGVVSISSDGKSVIYTAPKNFAGFDTFQYTADGLFTATVTIEVTNPVFDDNISVNEDSVKAELYVLSNDFPGGGDGTETRRISSVGKASHGEVEISPDGSTILYSPIKGYIGNDSFQYFIGDSSATVTIWVQHLLNADHFVLESNKDQVLDVFKNDGLASGSPRLDLRITEVSNSKTGASIRISEDGKRLHYSGGQGRDQFSYTVNGNYTTTVWVDFVPWLGWDQHFIEQNDGATSLQVLANDFIDRYTLEKYGEYRGNRVITGIVAGDAVGRVEIAADGKSLVYTPAKDFHGTETFQYVVDGFLSNSVTVNVVKYARDDQYRVSRDSTENQLPVLLNDSPAVGKSANGRITSVSNSLYGGQVSISQDGQSIRYSPARGFVGKDRLTYYVNDKHTASVEVDVQPSDTSSLQRFASMEQFKSWMLDGALQTYQHMFGTTLDSVYGNKLNHYLVESSAFSDTNVQVAGVDEADLIENDGKHLFLLRGHELIIADAYPSESMSVLSRVAVPGTGIGIYLSGNRVAVVSREYQSIPLDYYMGSSSSDFVPPVSTSSIVSVFDVTDRSKPALVQQTKLDGNYFDSRRIGNKLYLVQNTDIHQLPAPKPVTLENGQMRYEDRESYIARVNKHFAQLVEGVLPGYESYDGEGKIVRSGVMIQPEDIYQPGSDSRFQHQMLSIVELDMSSDESGLGNVLGVMTSSNAKVYVTKETLYVFETQYNEDNTRIRQFGLTGNGIEYQAHGVVPGSLATQFNADEHDGNLRVVTATSIMTTEGPHYRSLENAVYVLRRDNDLLEIIGANQGLPLNAPVRAVRFHGNRAIANTGSANDAPVAIDLSSPELPKILGSVPMVSFNDYLQFIDDNRLLSVGRNTSGGPQSITVTLYDATNLTDLRILGQSWLTLPSTSLAVDDHHAFGWFKELGSLVLPVQSNYKTREDRDQDGYPETILSTTKEELYFFKIDPSADREHAVLQSGSIDSESRILRPAFIDEVVYLFSEDSLIAIDIASQTKKSQLELVGATTSAASPSPSDSLDDARTNAAVAFASRLGVNVEQIQTVSVESANGEKDDYHIVLRYKDRQDLYRSTGSNATVMTTDFVFAEDRWQNSENPLDTNRDNVVTPVDALQIINDLDQFGAHQLGSNRPVRAITSSSSRALVDSNGDGLLSASDALLVINWLDSMRRQASASSEQATPPIDELERKRRFS